MAIASAPDGERRPDVAPDDERPAEGRRLEARGEPLVVKPEDYANSVVELIHRSVERYPDKEALRWKPPKRRGDADSAPAERWVSRTYRELWEWVTDLSLGLEALGVGDGDAVCIAARTRPEWVVADLAALALGAVTCPIYPQSEPAQAAFVMNNVRARVVFVENAQQATKVASVRAECPTLEHVIAFDAQGRLPEGTLTLDDVMARADRDPAKRGLWRERWAALRRDHLATIIHTSGTTGNPKGAMLSHGNLLFNFDGANQVIDFYPTDLFLSFLPLSHIYGRIVDEFISLGKGATVAYAEPLLERLPANMVEVRPTAMAAVPRLYERVYSRVLSAVEAGSPTKQRIFRWAQGLGAKKYRNHLDGRSNSPLLALQLRLADRLVFSKIRERTGCRVRYFVSGSAPLSREIGEFFYAMGMLVIEGYGLTETSPFVSVNRPGDFVFGTVGRPAPDTDVRIDAETGEILVRGPQVMQGYLNQPEETARAIDADGFFHTGDIGELDDIGRIKITDRLKNILVLANSKNVSPAPMEAALSTSRFVAQAVILGDRQPYTGALIAPDFEELGRWAAANGMAEMPPAQLVEQPAVRKLIEAEARRTLDGFAVFERPRRVALLPRLLSEEEGELTPSLKTKLRVVKEKWADRIDYLFDEKGG
ncbi:MAG TPA: long-chain fatty acid--CoA ligase, partial [Candidatus Limnocylindria bacterium]|nr:long-chain fatty acid--CoA ligase [Candidatus Limnocylindria bacterium]